MLNRFLTMAALICCCSCSTDSGPESIPEIPAGDRHAYVEQQLESARSRAVQRPEDAEALGGYATALHKYGVYEQAASTYELTRRAAPRDFRWAYFHGHVLETLGRDNEALDAFRAAARIDPRAGSTYLGVIELKMGEVGKAHKTLLDALTYDEGNGRALYELGRLEIAEGNLEKAEEYLLGSLASGSSNPSIYYALADLKKRQGDPQQAAHYLERFSATEAQGATWPDPWLASLGTSDSDLMSAAVGALQRGDIPRAIQLNEQARALNPENPLPVAALIGLYAIVGENEKSEAALEAARELDPDSAQFHYNVGLARMAQNRLGDAEASMLRVTVIDPQGSLAWTKLAEIHTAQRDKDKTMHAYAQAHERDPANDDVRLKLGVLYSDTRQFEQALELLEEPVAGDINEARRLWAIGRAYRYLDNVERAREALTEANAAALRAGDLRLAAAIRGELDILDAGSSS